MCIGKLLHKHNDKLRFAIIGIGNTLLDFTILNICSLAIGLPEIVGNTISTTICMCISFLLNKKFTFKSTGKNYLREIILFFVFTIIGMWIIQNGIIYFITTFAPIENEFWKLNIAKLFATIISTCCNYITYKNFVFKSDNKVMLHQR